MSFENKERTRNLHVVCCYVDIRGSHLHSQLVSLPGEFLDRLIPLAQVQLQLLELLIALSHVLLHLVDGRLRRVLLDARQVLDLRERDVGLVRAVGAVKQLPVVTKQRFNFSDNTQVTKQSFLIHKLEAEALSNLHLKQFNFRSHQEATGVNRRRL